MPKLRPVRRPNDRLDRDTYGLRSDCSSVRTLPYCHQRATSEPVRSPSPILTANQRVPSWIGLTRADSTLAGGDIGISLCESQPKITRMTRAVVKPETILKDFICGKAIICNQVWVCQLGRSDKERNSDETSFLVSLLHVALSSIECPSKWRV